MAVYRGRLRRAMADHQPGEYTTISDSNETPLTEPPNFSGSYYDSLAKKCRDAEVLSALVVGGIAERSALAVTEDEVSQTAQPYCFSNNAAWWNSTEEKVNTGARFLTEDACNRIAAGLAVDKSWSCGGDSSFSDPPPGQPIKITRYPAALLSYMLQGLKFGTKPKLTETYVSCRVGILQTIRRFLSWRDFNWPRDKLPAFPRFPAVTISEHMRLASTYERIKKSYSEFIDTIKQAFQSGNKLKAENSTVPVYRFKGPPVLQHTGLSTIYPHNSRDCPLFESEFCAPGQTSFTEKTLQNMIQNSEVSRVTAPKPLISGWSGMGNAIGIMTPQWLTKTKDFCKRLSDKILALPGWSCRKVPGNQYVLSKAPKGLSGFVNHAAWDLGLATCAKVKAFAARPFSLVQNDVTVYTKPDGSPVVDEADSSPDDVMRPFHGCYSIDEQPAAFYHHLAEAATAEAA